MGKSFLKELKDEFPKSIARILEGLLLLALGAMLSLLFGTELREAIAHRTFVFISAVEQILALIPKPIYLSVFLALLIALFIYRYKFIALKAKSTKDYLEFPVDFGDIIVLAKYKNPSLQKDIDSSTIVSSAQIVFICKKCSYRITSTSSANSVTWSCQCPNKTFSPDIILSHQETIRKALLENLMQPIPIKRYLRKQIYK